MKNIGIITFHRAHNYGALLQAYALQKALETKENNVKIIDYYNAFLYDQYKVFKPISKNPLKTLKHLMLDIVFFRVNRKRFNAFGNFIDDQLKLCKTTAPFDYLITGSDQVWNRNLTNGLDDVFSLNFDDNKIKIAYAASVGDSKIVYQNMDEYKHKLKNIDFISVREEDAVAPIFEATGKEITVNVDPTLLLTKAEWKSKIGIYPIINGGYIFAYSVGKGNDLFYKIVNMLADNENLKIVHFERNKCFNKFRGRVVSCYGVGPFEFLNLLFNSKYVVTSSFHGLVFSLLFHKNAFVVANNKPERLLSLMKKTNTESLLVANLEDFNKRDKINWGEVDSEIEKLRKSSIRWLEDKLEKKNG